MPLGHLYVLWKTVCLCLCPFFNQVICVFDVEFYEFLCILDINPLPDLFLLPMLPVWTWVDVKEHTTHVVLRVLWFHALTFKS